MERTADAAADTVDAADAVDAVDAADTADTAESYKRDIVGIFDRAAPDYDGRGVAFFGPLGADLVAAVGVRAGDDVVDFACGRGAVLFPAAEAAGLTGTVRAFDLAPTMVHLTGAEAARRGLHHVSVALGDAEHPDLPPACADVVLCGLALFLLPAPAEVIARWAGLLRPGGRVGVSVFGAYDKFWEAESFPLRRYSRSAQPGAPRPPGSEILAAGAVEAAMEAAGLTGVAARSIACDVVLRDVAHWWEWGWGTGYRRLLENVPPDAKPRLVEELAAYLEPVTDSGGVHWRPTIRIVTARLP